MSADRDLFWAPAFRGWIRMMCAGLLLFTVSLSLHAASLPAYDEGDRLQANVVTPVALEVVDPLRTEKARQEAADREPAIYRYETTTANQAEADLRREFAQNRRLFLQAMKQAAKRTKLDETTVQHASFARFVDWYRQQHPEFLLPDGLARQWALHTSDTATLGGWVAHLRQSMNQCIGDSNGLVSEDVRMVPAPDLQTHITERMVERNGVTLKVEEFFTLAKARSELQAYFSDRDPELGLFLQRFIRENCFLEATLTEQARLAAVTDVLALDRYEAGEIIGHRGQLVDARIKAAIELLRVELGSGASGANKLSDPVMWKSEGGRFELWADPLRFEKVALLGLAGLALVSVLGLVTMAWMVKRKRRLRHQRFQPPEAVRERDTEYTVVMNPQRNETVFLPMPETENTGAMVEPPSVEKEPGTTAAASGTGCAPAAAADEFWQQRAMEAEQRAEEILGMVRAGLAPQLAKQMMHRLVRELISQRSEWLQTQRLAETDLVAIEQRFMESHRQLQARLLAFEKRAVELENALDRKAEENSELIKAHISLTQQQLKAKGQSKEELYWN